uniref:ribonuclease H n=1 Tax=Gasterosteus aculeatus aculeatus TaxID=481459 RepID=A0AAQ4RT80_GASAC
MLRPHMIREVKHTHTAACNEETLSALTPCTHTHTHTHTLEQQQALVDITEQLRKQQKLSLKHTYAKFSGKSFENMPTTMVQIQGKLLSFLVDSGATHSVIQQKYFPGQKLSGKQVFSQGASGMTIVERFTAPMTSTHTDSTDPEPDITVKHSFLLSSCCPINLMGRDLMCSFGISLISTPTGLQVVRCRAIDQMAKTVICDPMFVYQWWLPVDSQSELSHLAASRVQPEAECMDASYLHCTAHVSHGPDKQYDALFLQDLNDQIACMTLFWSTLKCAVSVSLTPSQQHLFNVDSSFPHISLSKAATDQWRDLGPFVAACEALTDWEATPDPLVMRSPSTGFFKQPFAFCTPALRSVYVMDENNIFSDTHTDTFLTNVSSISPALSSVPDTLWAAHKYDVGLIKKCQPVVITPRSDFRPHKHQYPLRQEAIDGITPVFNSLLKAGVIVPCPDSPVRTPIFPVKKIRDAGKPTEWRFVQDLKAVNAAVHARAPNVPNPYTIMAQVPPDARWFSVVDLSNAFFSVPVDIDSQFWFAFNFNGKPYTFTRLCQGYTESPTIYNEALRESLESLTLSPGTALLQYVDDCLIAAPTQKQCEQDTLKLLQHLAAEGHKASLSKLQFVSQNVHFLGHNISGEGKTLSPKRIASIVTLPKPQTKKQMMSFLGMCSYCRSFIPNYSQLEQPLSSLIHGKNLSAHDKIQWLPAASQAFTDMKCTLQVPPTLGLPDSHKPFTQTVDERSGCMTSVLLQSHGDKLRPVAYFSAKLDPVAAGLPQCLRAVAAAEKALTASRDIVGYATLTLLVPHSVSLILLEQKSSHLSAARYLRYHTCLLDMPNVTVKRCNVLNPASLLPTPEDGEEHNCLAELEAQCTPRPDLADTPLLNSDVVMYVDGSASRDPLTGSNLVGFSVVSDSTVLCSGPLPCHLSAQAAELIALTEACKLAKDKTTTIHTDSRYAFGVVHDFGALWRHRNFLKSDGKPVLHHTLIAELLDAILLPTAIAVCKCAAHTSGTGDIAKGNERADLAAKAAARRPLPKPSRPVPAMCSLPSSLAAVQSLSTSDERRFWSSSGSKFIDGIWYGPNGNPCLPKHFFPHYAKLTHGLDHVSKGGMLSIIDATWFTKGFAAYAQRFCQACITCATHNVGRSVQVSHHAAHPPPARPFEHVMMDFVELSPSEENRL